MTDHDTATGDWSRLNALADPVRRRLYEYVIAQDGPVRREEAAEAADISRTLAAYHLDRLAEAGLLSTSYARTTGRTGPGAGRPAKHYMRAEEEVAVSVPPRSYGLLARLLAEAISADPTGEVGAAVMQIADAEGRAAAAEGGELLAGLQARGYAPIVRANGDVELRNCPFHQLAQQHTELVCNLNHALLRGCLAGSGQDPDRAELKPCPGRCCVVIHPAAVPDQPLAGKSRVDEARGDQGTDQADDY